MNAIHIIKSTEVIVEGSKGSKAPTMTAKMKLFKTRTMQQSNTVQELNMDETATDEEIGEHGLIGKQTAEKTSNNSNSKFTQKDQPASQG